MPEELTNEDIEKLLKAKFEEGAPASDKGEDASGKGDGTPVTPVAVEPPPPTSETEPQTETTPITEWEFDTGKKIDKATAQRYLDFDAFLEENPEFKDQLAGLGTGAYQIVPVGEQVTTPQTETSLSLPDDIDKDDPTVKFFMDQISALQSKVDEANSQLSLHQSQLNLQNSSTTEALISRARKSFQSDHRLSDEDMQKVYNATSQVNLSALMSPTDPTTGLPRKVDPLVALEQAFGIAYWSLPDYRQQYESQLLDNYRQDQEKKQKLSALGGSNGPVSHDAKPPTSPAEMKAAAVREVAAAMFPERLGEYE